MAGRARPVVKNRAAARPDSRRSRKGKDTDIPKAEAPSQKPKDQIATFFAISDGNLLCISGIYEGLTIVSRVPIVPLVKFYGASHN
jgi:hypothetical protein